MIPDRQGFGLAKADVVIEAVVEDVEIKRALFARSNAKPNRRLFLPPTRRAFPWMPSDEFKKAGTTGWDPLF